MSFKGIRNAFFSGIFLVAPLGVTIWVIKFFAEKVGAPASKLFFSDAFVDSKGFESQFLGILIVFILIALLGWFSKFLIGRWFFKTIERIVINVPFIKPVYGTVQQIVNTFSERQKAVFQKVVLLEFPRKGIYALGFLTGDSGGEVKANTEPDTINVFVPTTPNPTSGFLVVVPKDDVKELQMTVAEGMKFIISGGAVYPEYDPELEEQRKVEVQNPKEISTKENSS